MQFIVTLPTEIVFRKPTNGKENEIERYRKMDHGSHRCARHFLVL